MAANKAVKAAGFDRCNNGDEITDEVVLVGPNVRPQIKVEICGSPASVVVVMKGKVLFSQNVVDSFAGYLPALALGDVAIVVVQLVPTASPWRIQTEAWAGNAVGYRHRKTNASGFPYPKFVMTLQGVA